VAHTEVDGLANGRRIICQYQQRTLAQGARVSVIRRVAGWLCCRLIAGRANKEKCWLTCHPLIKALAMLVLSKQKAVSTTCPQVTFIFVSFYFYKCAPRIMIPSE